MSTRYNTGNPIESTDVRDMSDNAKNFDDFANSKSNQFTDRFGVERKTIYGMNSQFDSQILNMGFTRVGTFATGSTLTNPRQTLLWDVADGGDGQEYGWSGEFPKDVPAASTPTSTGGVAAGAWISRFDPELRIQAREALRRSYAEAGYHLVDGSFEAGGTLVNANDILLHEVDGTAYNWDGVFPSGGKVVPQNSTPATTGGVGPDLWLNQAGATLREQLSANLMVYAAPSGGIGRMVDTRLAEALYAADYGAKGDGVTDDTLALTLLFTAAKARGVPARLHAGAFKVSSTLPVNGVCIVGALRGYFNRQGTTIAGDGTFDIIAQTTYKVEDLTCYIKNIRVTDGITGFNFAYMVNSIFENLFAERCTDGFRLGRSNLFGPLFNECINVNARDMLRYGVVIAGNVNCNNNIFRQGYWDGRTAGFYQEAIVGGTGAVNNVFQSVEMGGANSPVGAIFEGRTYATSIRDCYFEPKGTNIWFKGVTGGCSLDNNLYAGHFEFATGRSSLVEFALISDVSVNGGFIFHANAANKQFTFLHADFSNEARYRDAYQFAANPKYVNSIGAAEKTYSGLTNFIQDNYKPLLTTSALGVTLKRDAIRNCIEKTLVKEFGTISEWTTIITIPGAAQNFGHSLNRILVVMSCRNTLDYYLLGFELSVTLAYNSGVETINEHEKTIYGTSITNLVQYRTVISGSDVLLQVSPTSAIVDQCFITAKITAAGSHVGDVI